MTRLFLRLKKYWRLRARTSVTALALVLILSFSSSPKISANPPAAETPTPEQPKIFFHPMTGLSLEEPPEDLVVFSVVVENSLDAWPLSGVEDAFLVVEFPTEAFIPRLLVFFSSDQTVEKIGPVRSARPYFLDWVVPFQALFAHVGGSPAALQQIPSLDVFDLNEYANGEFFWRENDRAAPHNVYTSIEFLSLAWQENFSSQAVARKLPWNFLTGVSTPPAPSDPQLFEANIGSEPYRVTWQYDPFQNVYLRRQNGKQTLSEDGDLFLADNVLIMETDMTVIDAMLHLDVRTTGEGPMRLLQNGETKNGLWKKSEADTFFRFEFEDGAPVKMNPGKIWIEVIPKNE